MLLRMKALLTELALAILLVSAITLCFAYKHKLDESNRYIEHQKQDCISNHIVRIGTNLMIRTRLAPEIRYSNEMFFIYYQP